MTKFICVTQMSSLASFTAPSGLNYQSTRGVSFEVTEPIDIAYFEKKRQFEKVGFFKKPKVEEKTAIEEDNLKSTLDEINDLSNTSKAKILSAYDLVSQVKDDLETNKQRFDIPEKQLDSLKLHLFGEEELIEEE